MVMVRGNLKNAKYKKDIRAGSVKMRKLERQLKKLQNIWNYEKKLLY